MTYEQRIRGELERVVGTDEWICVHCSPEDHEAFEVGAVAQIGTEAVILHTIDINGRKSGSRYVAFDSIFGITVASDYLETLRAIRETLGVPRSLEVAEPTPAGTLRAAQAEGLAVSLRLAEETVSGFVREVEEEWTAIEQFDGDNGVAEGIRIVSLDGTERVFVGGEDEMRLASVARARRLRDSLA